MQGFHRGCVVSNLNFQTDLPFEFFRLAFWTTELGATRGGEAMATMQAALLAGSQVDVPTTQYVNQVQMNHESVSIVPAHHWRRIVTEQASKTATCTHVPMPFVLGGGRDTFPWGHTGLAKTKVAFIVYIRAHLPEVSQCMHAETLRTHWTG